LTSRVAMIEGLCVLQSPVENTLLKGKIKFIKANLK
jgi:hypothetical protein